MIEIVKVYYVASGWNEGWMVDYEKDGEVKTGLLAQVFCNTYPEFKEEVEHTINSSVERRILGL